MKHHFLLANKKTGHAKSTSRIKSSSEELKRRSPSYLLHILLIPRISNSHPASQKFDCTYYIRRPRTTFLCLFETEPTSHWPNASSLLEYSLVYSGVAALSDVTLLGIKVGVHRCSRECICTITLEYLAVPKKARRASNESLSKHNRSVWF